MKHPIDLAGFKSVAEWQEYTWCAAFLTKPPNTCLRTPECVESCKAYLLSLREGATFQAAGSLIPYFYNLLEKFDYATATAKERRELKETWNEVTEVLNKRMDDIEKNNPSINNPHKISS